MTKAVRAWLRMHDDTSGTYKWHKSEENYRLYGDILSAVHPLNGGKIAADGTISEDTVRTDHAWAYGLKQWAQARGQLYMPVVRQASAANFQTVLDSATLRTTAVAAIVLWCTGTTSTGRFDSPWDGVDLNVEGVAYTYRSAMSSFIQELYAALNAAGKYLNVTANAIEADSAGVMTTTHYVWDYAVLADYADTVTMMNFTHGAMVPNIPGPFDWVEQCTQYALGKGVSPANLYIGLPLYCQYTAGAEVSYTQGLTLISTWTAPAWYEENSAKNRYRYMYGADGADSIWQVDYNVTRVHARIADQHNLGGIIVFGVGGHTYGEDVTCWRALEEWQNLPIWGS